MALILVFLMKRINKSKGEYQQEYIASKNNKIKYSYKKKRSSKK